SKIKILDHKHAEGTAKNFQENKVLRREKWELMDNVVLSDDEWEEHEYGKPPNAIADSSTKPYLDTLHKGDERSHKTYNENPSGLERIILNKIVYGIHWNQQIQFVISISFTTLDGPPVFDDDQYKEKIVGGDVGKGFVDNYPNFQEDGNNVSFLGVVLRVQEDRCQFIIPILKMSLRKKKDLSRKEDLVGKKTTSKTSYLWLIILALQ
nr:hypothetical protein [Tanacetum cinerariifolium]